MSDWEFGGGSRGWGVGGVGGPTLTILHQSKRGVQVKIVLPKQSKKEEKNVQTFPFASLHMFIKKKKK